MQKKINLDEVLMNPFNKKEALGPAKALLLAIFHQTPLQDFTPDQRAKIADLGELIGDSSGELLLEKGNYDFLKTFCDTTNCLFAPGWTALTRFIDKAVVVEGS